ncbi:hypothetical protein [Veillonella sp. LMAG:2]|nr:hypothetical protein [Veillonella sp. LMAG:2]
MKKMTAPLPNDILVAKDGSYLKEVFICSEYKECAYYLPLQYLD